MQDQDTPTWAVDDTKSNDLALEIKDPEGWYAATVRFDGCVHFYRYYNTPAPQDPGDESEDYIHICDIDDMIRRLEALKQTAVDHFGVWPV